MGNVTELVDSFEYDLSMCDKKNNIRSIKVYGIEEISSPIGPVNVNGHRETFSRN